MRHQLKGKRLGRSSAHRQALYRNLVTDLLKHGKITTTEVKAKEARGQAEKIITLGKKSSLHSYRQVLSFVQDKNVVDKLFTVLGPRYAERPGGYTRIIKLGLRLGDGASMVRLELVE